MDYREAGVDINEEEKFIRRLISRISFERSDLRRAKIPYGFTGLIEFGDFYIAMNTDGVGTKVLVANEMRKWDTVAVDCIAMNVNDTLTVGAEPIAFVDYISLSSYDLEMAEQIGEGLNRGAEEANITILGGETATLPEITRGIDIAGTSIGIVKKEDVITGERVEAGDVIFGIPSSGIHSNGLTLARKVFGDLHEKVRGVEIGYELLKPTRIYVREILPVLKECDVHGMAHITGGGLLNIPRMKRMRYIIDDPLEPHWIFEEISQRGGVSLEEMYRTFNMGMGFVLVAPEDCENELKRGIKDARVVGHVESGHSVEVPELGIRYEV